ncbi:MAG: phosphate signaling complex protein PhoU [Candidatus Azotimanducaceae bacterium]|uniref:Phosphate-specific transport system accessory protein PhoU n=1 Tax=OM182 bacterium TaxID=2510334 RepID=A0A520S4A3_9GAMM|nr:phosphate transport system regulatory protein PhoU [Gammaproteobacteria bacterium]OUV68198.1 MAG: phosphate transport system regulatory protein PhoU [Gammaproteobacteria bacterium TMED133]RZO77312.1 MAG: phosphate signaling complex protein PhoU [OM182 bacterium]
MKHLDKDLLRLENRISELGRLVIDSTNGCIQCIETFDKTLTAEILAGEDLINEMEVDIEEDCLKILALHQPVAFDLRFIIVALKVNNDLERMGDQALNIAERINFLSDLDRLALDLDFNTMGSICRNMVEKSLEALNLRDLNIAQEVVNMDDEVDALHARNYRVLQQAMENDPKIITPAISYLTISNNLERLADLATNIAEEIIFMEGGQVIRHQASQESW